MCLVFRKDLLPIENPDYSTATSDKAGAEVAMRFCVAGAESVIEHAASEGIPVEDCY
jgi:hypothetical protein